MFYEGWQGWPGGFMRAKPEEYFYPNAPQRWHIGQPPVNLASTTLVKRKTLLNSVQSLKIFI